MLKKTLLTAVVLLCGMMAAWAGPVTLVQPEHGAMSIAPTAPAAGETVTLTVTPEQGWEATADNIVVELTLNPGNAQAPRKAPQVGPQVGQTLAVTAGTEPNTFLFEMPQEPFGVRITATLTERAGFPVTYNPAPENGTVAVKVGDTTLEPGVTPVQEGTEVLIYATPNDGYQVASVVVDDNVVLVVDDDPYGGEFGAPRRVQNFTVTDKGEGVYSFVMPNTIVGVHVTFEQVNEFAITVSPDIIHGTITPDVLKAAEGTEVNLTVTPDQGYRLAELTYSYQGADGTQTAAITDNKFTMPASDVTINAKFWLRGDVNGDDVVDVTDVGIIVNMILGKQPKLPIADLDDDGNVDSTDLNIDINIVLGKE